MSYIYCVSNVAMPGIVKIATTENMGAMLAEANQADPWRPHIPYDVEFAKKVSNATGKVRAITSLLDVYAEPSFFWASPEEVRPLFDLMDGEDWIDVAEPVALPQVKWCRNMAECFVNGQQIRHVVGLSNWTGIFDSANRTILHNGTHYKSLSGFALAHYNHISPGRRSTVNGWSECEHEVAGAWVSTHKIAV
jgi:hypothetical protein